MSGIRRKKTVIRMVEMGIKFSCKYFSILLVILTVILVHCIDTVKKNPVSPGSRIVCQIDASKCNGCGLCAKACAYGAVVETQLDGEWVCYITPEKCNGCGECISACEDDAIRKVSYSDGE